MHILQNGIPKSGNLWLYTILLRVLEEAGIERRSYIQNHPLYPGLRQMDFDIDGLVDIDAIEIESHRCFAAVRQTFREALPDIGAYVDATTVVWSHSPWVPTMTPRVYQKFNKILYLIRDPRDAAISMSHFVFSPYRALYTPSADQSPADWLTQRYKNFIAQWTQHVCDHLAEAGPCGIYPIFYENLVRDTPGEIQRLAAHLDVALSPDSIERICRRVSKQEMKKSAPHHVRQDRAAGWQAVFTPAQSAWIDRKAGPLLSLLGYDGSDPQPGFDPDAASPDRIRGMKIMHPHSLFARIARRLG